MTTEQKTPTSEQAPGAAAPVEQAAEVAIAACSQCGSDINKSGYVEVKTTFQSYYRQGNKLVKSNKSKSEFTVIQCALCRASVRRAA